MWNGKVIPGERGTTEDLGCEPRCPNDTSAIKRRLATGDRRSQSVQSRSHALLLSLLWDKASRRILLVSSVDFIFVISTLEIAYLPFARWMLIERLATISNISLVEKLCAWLRVNVGYWKFGLNYFVCTSGDGYWMAIIEKFLRVDQVLFWLNDDLYVQK